MGRVAAAETTQAGGERTEGEPCRTGDAHAGPVHPGEALVGQFPGKLHGTLSRKAWCPNGIPMPPRVPLVTVNASCLDCASVCRTARAAARTDGVPSPIGVRHAGTPRGSTARRRTHGQRSGLLHGRCGGPPPGRRGHHPAQLGPPLRHRREPRELRRPPPVHRRRPGPARTHVRAGRGGHAARGRGPDRGPRAGPAAGEDGDGGRAGRRTSRGVAAAARRSRSVARAGRGRASRAPRCGWTRTPSWGSWNGRSRRRVSSTAGRTWLGRCSSAWGASGSAGRTPWRSTSTWKWNTCCPSACRPRCTAYARLPRPIPGPRRADAGRCWRARSPSCTRCRWRRCPRRWPNGASL